MNIHEYQAKAILNNYNVPIPKGEILLSAENLLESAQKVSKDIWVVKAQIHAGGRGKGGGVKIGYAISNSPNWT